MAIEEDADGATRRVFYALWPTPAFGTELERVSLSLGSLCGGRAMRRDTLHMTLAFIGAVESHRVADLQRIGQEMRGCAFELEVNGVLWQRRKRIVWAECSRIPHALEQLVERLARCLGSGGFPLEARPFKPHITLVRNARCLGAPAAPEPPLTWSVGEFALVESQLAPQGAIYRVVSRWALS